MSEVAEIVPIEQKVPQFTALTLLHLAVEKGASMDTIRQLSELQEKMVNREAELAFNSAMQRAQEKMEPVRKDLWNPQTKSKYASYKALSAAVKPHYSSERFSISFNTGTSTLPEHVLVLANLIHAGGHTGHYQVDMPIVTAGFKGTAMMTPIHATGSGVSYGKRYLLKMIWDIVEFGEDDDGNAAGKKAEDTAIPQASREHWLNTINSCKDRVELQKAYFAASDIATKAGDKESLFVFTKAKEAKVDEFKKAVQK